MTDVVDVPNEVDVPAPGPKLPPLNIRPFQAQDYSQIRQLIGDSQCFNFI